MNVPIGKINWMMIDLYLDFPVSSQRSIPILVEGFEQRVSDVDNSETADESSSGRHPREENLPAPGVMALNRTVSVSEVLGSWGDG